VPDDKNVDLQAVAAILRWFVGRFRHYERWATNTSRRAPPGEATLEPSQEAPDRILTAMLGRYRGLDRQRADHIAVLMRRFVALYEQWFTERIRLPTRRKTSLTRRDFYLWLLFRRLSRVFQIELEAGAPLPRLRQGAFLETGVPYTDAVRAIVEAYDHHLKGLVGGSAPRAAARELIARLAGRASWFGRGEATLKNVHLFVVGECPSLLGSRSIDWKAELQAPFDPEAPTATLDPAIEAATLIDALTASDIDDRSMRHELLEFFARTVLGYDEEAVASILRAASGAGRDRPARRIFRRRRVRRG
jgi:hypothetical protein